MADIRQGEKTMNEDVTKSKFYMGEYLNAQTDVYKLLEGSNKYIIACIETVKKVQSLLREGKNPNEIAEYIKNIIMYISRNNAVFKNKLSKVIAHTNSMVKTINSKLAPMYEIEFSCELDPNASMSACFKRVAENMQDVLETLAYMKAVLMYDCGKINLPKAVDAIYTEIKQEIIPAYINMSQEAERMFTIFHQSRESIPYLRDPKLVPSDKVIQVANVVSDDYAY